MRRRGGFSLIELLVAISIIAILAAIIFPVFITARERGKRVYCANNMRQIYLALQMYADDNYGFLPPQSEAIMTDTNRHQITNPYAGFALLDSYVKGKNVFICPNSDTRFAASIGETPYTLYKQNGKAFTCTYHFWPSAYGYYVAGIYNGVNYTSGRLDCNLRDQNLMLRSIWKKEQCYKDALAVGGPLVDDSLHYYGGNDVGSRYGILCLTVRGSVKFLPNGKYPWRKNL